MVVGIILGYMIIYNDLDGYFNFSAERAIDWEQSCLISWAKHLPGFITVDSAQQYTYELEGQLKPSEDISNKDDMLLNSTPPQEKDVGSDTGLEEGSREADKDLINDVNSEYVTVLLKVNVVDQFEPEIEMRYDTIFTIPYSLIKVELDVIKTINNDGEGK